MDKNIFWIDENEKDLEEVSVERAHTEGLLHRIACVYLTNNNGQILVQKRVDGRLDHSAAGHVDIGESYLDAAKRELFEELGVSSDDLKEIGFCISNEKEGKVKHKFKVYACKANPERLNPDEVQEVFWSDPLQVWTDMKQDTLLKEYTGGFKVTLDLFLKHGNS